MKSFLLAVFFATTALAQFDQNSRPFRLFLKSANGTLDGQSVGACHQGAAIEGLCPSGLTRADEPTSYDTFYHQTPSNPTFTVPDDGDTYGYLVWNLTVNTNLTIPSYMEVKPDLTSDVVNPIIRPGNSTAVAVSFTSGGCMYFPKYQDDTVSPPAYISPPQKIESWYTCLTRWSYLYVTLSWKVGVKGDPQNPSCEKVQVIREFI